MDLTFTATLSPQDIIDLQNLDDFRLFPLNHQEKFTLQYPQHAYASFAHQLSYEQKTEWILFKDKGKLIGALNVVFKTDHKKTHYYYFNDFKIKPEYQIKIDELFSRCVLRFLARYHHIKRFAFLTTQMNHVVEDFQHAYQKYIPDTLKTEKVTMIQFELRDIHHLQHEPFITALMRCNGGLPIHIVDSRSCRKVMLQTMGNPRELPIVHLDLLNKQENHFNKIHLDDFIESCEQNRNHHFIFHFLVKDKHAIFNESYPDLDYALRSISMSYSHRPLYLTHNFKYDFMLDSYEI